MKNIAPSGEVKSNSDVNFSLNGKSRTSAYKPARYPSDEAEVYAELTHFFEPEYPELIPAVLAKIRPHLGTKGWAFNFPLEYTKLARERFVKQAGPFAPLPASDESLREEASVRIAIGFKKARERYRSTPLVYEPSIEDLRELWAHANAETGIYLMSGGNRKARLAATLMHHRNLVEAAIEALAKDGRRETPEYKAAVEAGRVKRAKEEVQREEKNAIWTADRRRRRVADMGLQEKGKADIGLICSTAGDYASEFFGQFFSEEYCGWAVQYHPTWNGYWFPPEAGEISQLLFSATGTVFLTDGETKGEKIPEWNFITTYGHYVCGYEIDKNYRFSPNEYRRAVVGFAHWLRREKDKRSGRLIEHGNEQYWTELLVVVTAALFDGQLDENNQGTIQDTRRNLYRRVKSAATNEELSLYRELATEKMFRKFLSGCLEESAHRERSLEYFRVKKSVSHNTEIFELTFNPGILPEEREKAEEHCMRLMTGKNSFVFNPPEKFIPPPENDPGEIDLFRDTNAEDEERQETVD